LNRRIILTWLVYAVASISISTLSLRAQGPPQYLWTWNGDSGLFQGSFETTADEMQPNAITGNGLFNLSITSPTGVWLSNLGSGDQTLFNYINSDTYGITVFGDNGLSLAAGSDGMSELLDGNTTLFGEAGYWSITEIPEPSILALLVAGAVTYISVRNRSRLKHKIS
jgi:hypothetical protein